MSAWTDDAKAYFARVIQHLETSFAGAPEDAAEFAQDIRLHVEEEIGRTQPALVTVELLTKSLTNVLGHDPLNGPPASAPEAPEPKPKPKRRILLWLAAVVLPAVTLVFEIVTRSCSNAFFDPIPTLPHALSIALVPLCGAWALIRLAKNRPSDPKTVFALGAASAVSAYYTIPFLPILPFAAIGVIYLGLGLLPLAPLLSLMAQARLIHLHQRGLARPRLTLSYGILCGILILAAAETPRYITKIGIERIASGGPATQVSGIKLLRNFGSKTLLAKACLPNFNNNNTFDWYRPKISPSQAQDAFYRVTGQEFDDYANTAESPFVEFGFRNRWDWHRGTQIVGRQLNDLHLESARLDGAVDNDAALAYLEWTLQFRNDARFQQEARALLELPDGAVISRVTLWVNGEPKEAAFDAKSKVIAAYQKVVRRRRDPLLVTANGFSENLFQCFPIPPDGGLMKIRLGITVPAQLADQSSGTFSLPLISARNFAISENFETPIWIESARPIDCPDLESSPSGNAIKTVAKLAHLESQPPRFRFQRDPAVDAFWGESPFDGSVIQGSIETRSRPYPKSWILVLDGSAGAKAHAGAILDALKKSAIAIESVYIASDELLQLDSPGAWPAEGGQNNAPALAKAWDRAANTPDAAILWIHGPQTRLRHGIDDLDREIARQRRSVPIYRLQYDNGHNLLLQHIERQQPIKTIPRLGPNPGDDLLSFLNQSLLNQPAYAASYRSLAPGELPQGKKVAPHLARLWALAEAKSILYSKTSDAYERSGIFAARNNLVTPASGAVVLENQAQYDEAGLEPTRKEAVQSIPDTGSPLLLLLAALATCAWLNRRRNAG